MKKVQKGFTLVELIVVITILAILGTIAFISLQGYSQDARDSKVVSDIRSITSALETLQTESGDSVHSYNLADRSTTNQVLIASGSTVYGTSTGSIALPEVVVTPTAGITNGYRVGNINFAALRQSASDFGTGTYVISTLTQVIDWEAISMYQVAWAKGAEGQEVAVIKGNFVGGTTLNGLVSDANSSDQIVDGDSISGGL